MFLRQHLNHSWAECVTSVQKKNKPFWCQNAASWTLRLLRGISLPCEFILSLAPRCWEAASLRVATVALWQITLVVAVLPFFSAGSILQGPDLPWVESMVPFYLHCRWLPWSVELQLLCSPCHHFTAVSRVREEVGDCLLVDVAYCCSHVAALSYSLSWWRCFQPCSYGPALPVTSSSGIFSRLLLSWTFLFWGWSSWTLGSLLERAPKFFLLHCSPHPTLPSSCADAKDFLLNTSASQNCDGCS